MLETQTSGRARTTSARRAPTGAERAPTHGLLALQRLAGNASVARLLDRARGGEAPVLDVVRSGRGRPLAAPVRRTMERRLGHDLSTVRVHTGAAAEASARAINADAYTVGENIVMHGRAYQPHTAAGRRMLAHELVHVIQQRLGPVSGVPVAGGIRLSEPSDRFEREADRVAEEVARPSGSGDRDQAPGALVVGRSGQAAEKRR